MSLRQLRKATFFRSKSQIIQSYSSLNPYFSLIKTHKKLFSQVFFNSTFQILRPLQYIIGLLKESPRSNFCDNKTILNKLEQIINEFGHELFISTKISTCIKNPNFNDFKKYRKIIFSVISICRLYESLISEQLPEIQNVTKGILSNLYGTL